MATLQAGRVQNRILHVQGAGLQPSKAAARALELTAKLELRGYVPFAGSNASGIQSMVHPTSEFMLGLLNSQLRDSGLFNLDLTVARCKFKDEDDEALAESVTARPALRAVRFEGRHLLDSIPPADYWWMVDSW